MWGPFNKADILLVEGVQRRATKLIPELRTMEYEDRLRKLRLRSLMYRRRRGDMILMHKIMNGLIDIPRESLFREPRVAVTRGHRHKVDKPRADNSRVRRFFFAVRVVEDWNGLPSWVVEATSSNSFKSNIDRHWSELIYKAPSRLRQST